MILEEMLYQSEHSGSGAFLKKGMALMMQMVITGDGSVHLTTVGEPVGFGPSQVMLTLSGCRERAHSGYQMVLCSVRIV